MERDSGPSTAVGYEPRRLPPLDRPDLVTRRVQDLRREPYQAAVPADLAPIRFDIDPQVLAEADDATRAIIRFDASYGDLPLPFAGVLLRSESASSSQIENLTAGARAIAEAEIGERASGNAIDVVHNVRAMQAAIDLASDVTDDSIIEMHRQLLGDIAPTLVGRYRDEQVWIGGGLPHTAAFVPPHHDLVPEAMDGLLAFLHRTDLPVLVLAAIGHAQFETIHPFPDGNGRTGRALVQSVLRRGGMLRQLTIPVSSGLLADLDAYFDALGEFRLGKVEPIVSVFASAALSALQNTAVLADDLRALELEWDARLVTLRSDATARRLARVTLEHPVVNARVAREQTGASQPVVDNALDQLTSAGILTPANSRQRNRIWINRPVVSALDAFAERSGRRQSPRY